MCHIKPSEKYSPCLPGIYLPHTSIKLALPLKGPVWLQMWRVNAHARSACVQVVGTSAGHPFMGLTLDESPCLSGLPLRLHLFLCEMGVGTVDKAPRYCDSDTVTSWIKPVFKPTLSKLCPRLSPPQPSVLSHHQPSVSDTQKPKHLVLSASPEQGTG